MSGQDYVYIVWENDCCGYCISDRLVTTFPTKYQAVNFCDKQQYEGLKIQRWRHGDSEGHLVE